MTCAACGTPRQGGWWLVIASIGCGAIALIVASLSTRERPSAPAVEIEPNDEPTTATPLAPGDMMWGSIGPSTGAASDTDYYRLEVDDRGLALRVDVTAVAGVDVVLRVLDAHGRRLAEADNSGAGFAEVIPNLGVAARGRVFIAVHATAVTPAGGGRYRVSAALRRPGPSDESEPNDDVASATRILAGLPTVAFAGACGDVDCFAVTGPGGGTLAVEASGLPDVDLAIDVRVPAGGAPERAGDAGGPSQAERVSGVAWPAGSPPPVFCVRRKESGEKKGEAPSLATPYFVLGNLIR